MKIIVNDQIYLSEFRDSDKPAFVQHLHDRDIFERTLRIPYPYTAESAEQWLALVAKIAEKQGRLVHFAIRGADDALIGVCGFNGFELGTSHQAEVGYWLGKPFWGQGIMTAVVGRICAYAFEEFALSKIIAHVFAHNTASARVLEKNGFHQEGYLHKHYLKNGRFIDAKLFAKLKSPIGDAASVAE